MKRAIIVHSLEHVAAALGAAKSMGVEITLHSAPGAARSLGALFFRDMVGIGTAGFPEVVVRAVLDCGEDPGLALNAFRHGIKAVRVTVPTDVQARLGDIARQSGAVLDEGDPQLLDLLDVADPEAACRDWLRPLREGGQSSKD